VGLMPVIFKVSGSLVGGHAHAGAMIYLGGKFMAHKNIRNRGAGFYEHINGSKLKQ